MGFWTEQWVDEKYDVFDVRGLCQIGSNKYTTAPGSGVRVYVKYRDTSQKEKKQKNFRIFLISHGVSL